MNGVEILSQETIYKTDCPWWLILVCAGIGLIIGIIISIIGLIGCGVNYPIYKKMLEKGKSKYAYEIVKLAREISEN